MSRTGTLIALAWPETKVIQEGKWYDEPMRWINVIKDGHYNAGHAAFLLIDNATGLIEYFDYGRYHTPMKYGRVRDKHTDPDIEIKLKANFQDHLITNLDEILFDRYNTKACHGDGKLTASIVKNIDYDKAYNKAKEMQAREAIYYGPFEFTGSTCSRFVAKVVLASTNDWLTKLLILIPYTISATPRSNNKVLNDCSTYLEIVDGKLFSRKSKFYGFKRIFNWELGEEPIPSFGETINI